MAISNKVDKSKHGPSMLEVGLGAVLSVLLGLALAVGYLIGKPARAVKKLPEEGKGDAGVVYYVEGTKDSSRSRQWRQKKQQFLNGSSIVVNEDEINAWLATDTSARPPGLSNPGGQAAEQPAAAVAGFISAGPSTFRIRDGVLQIGAQCSLNIDLLGIKRPLIVQATGRFEKTGDAFTFVADKYYVGSCAGHRLRGLGGVLLNYFITRTEIPEDVVAAWKKLADVSVEGSTLKLTVP